MKISDMTPDQRERCREELFQLLENPGTVGLDLFVLPRGMLEGVSVAFSTIAGLKKRFQLAAQLVHPDKNPRELMERCNESFKKLNKPPRRRNHWDGDINYYPCSKRPCVAMGRSSGLLVE